jgi:hypothetical protein
MRGFWPDVEQTEEWLQSLHKDVTTRSLILKGRSIAQLEPWLPWIRAPLEIEGWLNPMEVHLTWRYLLQFLVASGPDAIVIPCGGDAVVSWTPGAITIRAPHDTWVWAYAIDSWDPAGWAVTDRVEWWEHGRLQQAARTPWGLFEQWQYPYGMEEWRLIADAPFFGRILAWWEQLAERLGTRPVKVSWRQEPEHSPHSILGLPVRVNWFGLKISAEQPEFWSAVRTWPEPKGLRAEMQWWSPLWNEFWGTKVTLRRWRQSTRLEAQYTLLRGTLQKRAVKLIRQEMHRFPIFHMQAVIASQIRYDAQTWQGLEERAHASQIKEELIAQLRQYPWPVVANFDPAGRIRLPEGWMIDRLSSHKGVWTLRHQDRPVRVQVFWPRKQHAGNITVIVANQVNATLQDLDPHALIDRFSSNRRYWVHVVAKHLLPALVQCDYPAGIS